MAHSPDTSRSFFQRAAAAAAIAVVGATAVFGSAAHAQGPINVADFLDLPGTQQAELSGDWASDRLLEIAQPASPLQLCLSDAFTRQSVRVEFKDGDIRNMSPGGLRLQQLMDWANHNGYKHVPAKQVAGMAVDQIADEGCSGRSPNAETAQGPSDQNTRKPILN